MGQGRRRSPSAAAKARAEGRDPQLVLAGCCGDDVRRLGRVILPPAMHEVGMSAMSVPRRQLR